MGNYRHVCHKWHYKITKALVVCLESKDFVQIRNALIILTKIIPHFPVLVSLSGVLEKRIDNVCTEEKEKRKDLYIKAMSYSGQLKTRKASMLKEQDFHIVKNKSGSSLRPVPDPSPASPSPAKEPPPTKVQEKETGIPCARHRLPTHIDEARTQTMIKIQKGGRLKIQRMMMIVNGGTEVPKSPPMIGKTRKLMLAKGKGKIRAKIRENVVKMWKPSLIQIRKRGLGDVK